MVVEEILYTLPLVVAVLEVHQLNYFLHIQTAVRVSLELQVIQNPGIQTVILVWGLLEEEAYWINFVHAYYIVDGHA